MVFIVNIFPGYMLIMITLVYEVNTQIFTNFDLNASISCRSCQRGLCNTGYVHFIILALYIDDIICSISYVLWTITYGLKYSSPAPWLASPDSARSFTKCVECRPNWPFSVKVLHSCLNNYKQLFVFYSFNDLNPRSCLVWDQSVTSSSMFLHSCKQAIIVQNCTIIDMNFHCECL